MPTLWVGRCCRCSLAAAALHTEQLDAPSTPAVARPSKIDRIHRNSLLAATIRTLVAEPMAQIKLSTQYHLPKVFSDAQGNWPKLV